jgi:hypothetical protein
MDSRKWMLIAAEVNACCVSEILPERTGIFSCAASELWTTARPLFELSQAKGVAQIDARLQDLWWAFQRFCGIHHFQKAFSRG